MEPRFEEAKPAATDNATRFAIFLSALKSTRMAAQIDCSQLGDTSMNIIVPRWEWRTFRQDFGNAEPRFAALTPAKVQHSAETYVLVIGSEANVKFRDDLLDIKQLERVNDDGLEQWRPLLKEPFPLTRATTAQLRAALGLSAELMNGDAVTFEALIVRLESVAANVRIVRVTKTRTRYHAHGCVAELSDVVADGKKVRTVAIEDEDPAKVMAAVRAMELDCYANINYPCGLKQLIGIVT
jgi:exopolyphosphatase/guanosine-5'-triphosphate,3'-diphosphate pyrophosphatase